MLVAMFAQRSCAPQHLAGADSSAYAGADSAPHSSSHAMSASPTTPSNAVPSTPSGAGPSTPPELLKLKEPIFLLEPCRYSGLAVNKDTIAHRVAANQDFNFVCMKVDELRKVISDYQKVPDSRWPAPAVFVNTVHSTLGA